MEMFTEVLKLGHHLILPKFIILLDEVGLSRLIKLLNQTTEMYVVEHLKVCLALNVLVVPHPIEETVRPVLNLDKGP